jgi:hypothetical protein
MKILFPMVLSVGIMLALILCMLSMPLPNYSTAVSYADSMDLKGSQINGIVHKGTAFGGIHPLLNQ